MQVAGSYVYNIQRPPHILMLDLVWFWPNMQVDYATEVI
jgi:hypothetical protein